MSQGSGLLAFVTNGLYGDGDEIGWATLTIGNLRTTSIARDIVGDITSLNTTHNLATSSDSPILGPEVAWQLAINDVVVCAAFLLYLVYMRYSTYAVQCEIDANLITTSRYSVLVRGLPADATEHEVRRHFSDLYQLSSPDWEYHGGATICCGGRKAPRLVKVSNKTLIFCCSFV